MKSFMWVSHEIGDVVFLWEWDMKKDNESERKALSQEEQVEKLCCIINDVVDDVEHDS